MQRTLNQTWPPRYSMMNVDPLLNFSGPVVRQPLIRLPAAEQALSPP